MLGKDILSDSHICSVDRISSPLLAITQVVPIAFHCKSCGLLPHIINYPYVTAGSTLHTKGCDKWRLSSRDQPKSRFLKLHIVDSSKVLLILVRVVEFRLGEGMPERGGRLYGEDSGALQLYIRS
jgi:hypothetical protein